MFHARKKTFKFRIFPNQKQIKLINKTIGCSRFVFNFFLAKQKEKDAYWYIIEEMVQNGQLPLNNWKGEFFNKYDSVKAVRQIKEYYPFLKEVDSISLQKSVENPADSYQRYYRKQNKTPKFKSKKMRCNLIVRNKPMGISLFMINTSSYRNLVLFGLQKAAK